MEPEEISKNVPDGPRRFSWVLVIFALNGLVVSLIFVGFAFPQLRSSAVQPTSPVRADISTLTRLDLTDPRAGGVQRQGRLQVGQPAPDFTLRTLDGGERALSDFRGQAVLINFWASWCVPCRSEMPDLVNADRTYSDQGFVILGVNLTVLEVPEDIQTFVSEFKVTFPVLLDETGEVAQNLYGMPGLPMSVFVDRKGMITHIHVGAMTPEQIDRYVKAILE